jgi:hypothetical protein
VGIEIVHYQHDLLGFGVVNVDQILYAVRPVELGPPLGDTDVAPTGQRLANDEQVCSSFSLILVDRGGWAVPSWWPAAL